MATYVMFGKYSSEAMKGASKNRTAEANAVIQKCGVDSAQGYLRGRPAPWLLLQDAMPAPACK